MWYLMLTTADGVGVISSIAQLLPPLGNFFRYAGQGSLGLEHRHLCGLFLLGTL